MRYKNFEEFTIVMLACVLGYRTNKGCAGRKVL